MLAKSTGIILKSTKYSETSLILDIFTESKGLCSFIVSGVRKASARSQGAIYQVMNMLEFIAYDKGPNKLSRIKEAKMHYAYQEIPFDVRKSSIALFFIDLFRNAIREQSDNNELFHFIVEWLKFLDNTENKIVNLHLLFVVELAQKIGFEFQNNYTDNACYFNLENGNFSAAYFPDQYHLDKSNSLHLHQLLQCDRVSILEWKLSSEHRRALLNQLLLFFKYHVEGFRELKSMEIFRTVLS